MIDFQGDARDITYDLVSLLRGCYLDNDPNWIDQKSVSDGPNHQGISRKRSRSEFLRWFDLPVCNATSSASESFTDCSYGMENPHTCKASAVFRL